MVITGARGTFVAGADVKELLKIGEKGDLESAVTLPNAAQTAFSIIEDLDIPVIAAVNGPALGGGNELVLACSHVIAARHAEFGQPEINLNLLPGYGGTQRLVRKLFHAHGKDGAATALRMMFDGRTIDAETAKSIGLIDSIVSEEGLSPVEAAMAALRDHFAGGDSLKVSSARRKALKDNREQSVAIDASIVEHAGVALALQQIRNSGRNKPADMVIDAVLTGEPIRSLTAATADRRDGDSVSGLQVSHQTTCDPTGTNDPKTHHMNPLRTEKMIITILRTLAS